MRVWPNGIGEASGDQLVTQPFLQLSGDVWFVQSTNGVDAAAPAGQDKERPLATLAQAHTNAADGDIVVLLPAHTETRTSAITITKKLTIVGAGSVGGVPSVRFAVSAASVAGFICQVAALDIRNIYFRAAQAAVGAFPLLWINTNADMIRLTGLYLECGPLASTSEVCYFQPAATNTRISSCTFVSTATVVTARPKGGLLFNTTNTDCELVGNVFDDGVAGFVSYAFLTNSTNPRLRAEGNVALRGATIAYAGNLSGHTSAQLHGGARTYTAGALNSLSGGLGEVTGDALAIEPGLQLSGNVWFVNSVAGVDAALPRGLNRACPLATLSQAVTNAANNDIIVLMEGHSESIGGLGLSIAKSLTIVGGGTVNGKPGATLTNATTASAPMLAIAIDGVSIRNVYFPAATNAASGYNISWQPGVNSLRVYGCYFEQGANDGFAAIGYGVAPGVNHRYVNNTFVSVATSSAARPAGGVSIPVAVSDMEFYGNTFDDGTYGFLNPALNVTVAATRLKIEALTLLRGADVFLHASTTGFVTVANATGGGKVVW